MKARPGTGRLVIRGVGGFVALLLPALGSGSAAAEPPAAGAKAPWAFNASAAVYFLPDDPDYVQPTFTADRGSLHLEGRYDYEDRKTASFFLGRSFEFGEKLTLALTPMLGGVAGRTNGVAPGLELTLSRGAFELYSESEYVIDLGDSDSSFFYDWSELSLNLTKWLRAGAVLQRTRVFRTPREVSVGALAGVSFGKVSATGYWFEPGAEGQFAVVSVGVAF